MIRKMFLMVAVSLFFVAGIFAQGGSSATPSPTSTPAATTAKPARFTPTKTQIEEGQKFLKDKKLYTGAADGKYNDDTRAAIRTFQKDNGLDVTGNFNKATVEKMNIALTDKQKGFTAPGDVAGMKVKEKPKTSTEKPTTSGDGPKRPAPFTANKDQITDLQKVLKTGKMFAGEANGERSDALKDAVKAYQKANGLKETGGINAATLEKAGIALTDKQKDQVAAQAAYDAAKAPKN